MKKTRIKSRKYFPGNSSRFASVTVTKCPDKKVTDRREEKLSVHNCITPREITADRARDSLFHHSHRRNQGEEGCINTLLV